MTRFCVALVFVVSCSSEKTTGTIPEETPCGNGIRDAGELCDGVDLVGQSCTSAGYDGGYLGCSATCEWDFSACTGEPPVCGDNLAEGFELCDGDDLRGLDCSSAGFEGGALGCNNCELDTSGCTGEPPACGDGNAEGLEQCDGLDLRQLDCAALGFDGGTLSCDVNCQLYTGGCFGIATVCGDGEAQGVETCDGDDTNGVRCEDLGYDGGTLNCDPSCILDTSECTGTPAVCGDDVLDGLEECDGTDLGGATCTDLDYAGGELTCDDSCTFDPSGCSRPECGNQLVEPGEECDGNNLDGLTCSDIGLGSGELGCLSSCSFDTQGCEPPTCGDGAVNQPLESCDGNDLAGETCRTLGFERGQLLCFDDCAFNTFYCWGSTAECGDGEVALSEDCDGDNLNDTTCVDLAYDGGELACVDCNFDTDACTGSGPTCPNGTAEGDEMCDGDDLRGLDCLDFGFTGGTLVCSPQCMLSFVGCSNEPTCGNNTAERFEPCDGTDLRGQSCESLDVGVGELGCQEDCTEFDFSDCSLAPACGNDVAEAREVCDGSDLGDRTVCTSFGYLGDEAVACLPTCAAYDLSSCTQPPPRCGNDAAQGAEQCDGDDLRNATCEDLGYASGELACNTNCSFDLGSCTL